MEREREREEGRKEERERGGGWRGRDWIQSNVLSITQGCLGTKREGEQTGVRGKRKGAEERGGGGMTEREREKIHRRTHLHHNRQLSVANPFDRILTPSAERNHFTVSVHNPKVILADCRRAGTDF